MDEGRGDSRRRTEESRRGRGSRVPYDGRDEGGKVEVELALRGQP